MCQRPCICIRISSITMKISPFYCFVNGLEKLSTDSYCAMAILSMINSSFLFNNGYIYIIFNFNKTYSIIQKNLNFAEILISVVLRFCWFHVILFYLYTCLNSFFFQITFFYQRLITVNIIIR